MTDEYLLTYDVIEYNHNKMKKNMFWLMIIAAMLSSEISNLCFQKLKGNEETSNMNIYIIVGFFPI